MYRSELLSACPAAVVVETKNGSFVVFYLFCARCSCSRRMYVCIYVRTAVSSVGRPPASGGASEVVPGAGCLSFDEGRVHVFAFPFLTQEGCSNSRFSGRRGVETTGTAVCFVPSVRLGVCVDGRGSHRRCRQIIYIDT